MITGMKMFTPINMDNEESLYYQKRAPIVQRPLAVPSDLAEEIQEFHSFPFGWFISQFFIYVMQPKDHLLELISRRRRELANIRPLVGYVIIYRALFYDYSTNYEVNGKQLYNRVLWELTYIYIRPAMHAKECL